MERLAVQLLLLAGTPLAAKLRGRESPAWRSGYHWASSGGSAFRTGSSAAVAPRRLSGGPAWSFQDLEEEAYAHRAFPATRRFKNFGGLIRAGPLIDDQHNIFLTAVSMGTIYKFSPEGKVLWTHRHSEGQQLPGVSAILDGQLFAAQTNGEVFALDMDSGVTSWERALGTPIAGDTWSLAAGDGVVIIPTTSQNPQLNDQLVALRSSEGSKVWEFSVEGALVNAQVSIKDGSCVFSTTAGKVYRLDLWTGNRIWETPAPANPDYTTGGHALGPDGQEVFVAWNQRGKRGHKTGMLAALGFEDGRLLWKKGTEYEANGAPAVGRLGKDANMSVVVGLGENPPGADASQGIAAGKGLPKRARVLVLDAATGNKRWSYELPVWRGAAAGDDERPNQCRPDALSNPSIGGDGTLYVGSRSGLLYSIRDDDADGSISDAEVSTFQANAGFQGSPAIAPGMLVAAPCDGLHVWRANTSAATVF